MCVAGMELRGEIGDVRQSWDWCWKDLFRNEEIYPIKMEVKGQKITNQKNETKTVARNKRVVVGKTDI